MRTATLSNRAVSRRSLQNRAPELPAARPAGSGRSDCRYPVAADVTYQLIGRGNIQSGGRGRTVNISSGGILLETEDALPIGVYVDVQIAWPVKLDLNVGLTLHVRGRTLRSAGNFTAIVIDRHEFRTRRQPAIDDEEAAGPLLQRT